METRNAQKNTPLMLAAAAGHVSTVRDGARRRVCVLRILACAVSEARWCTQVAALLAGRGSMEAKGQHGLTAHGHAIANGHAPLLAYWSEPGKLHERAVGLRAGAF